MVTRYATIKRGKVKLKIGSAQDKLLHTRGLPHSHVTVKNGKKTIKRYGTTKKKTRSSSRKK